VSLETAYPQVAAVAVYGSAGYTPIEAFGYYTGHSQGVNLGRPLGKRRS
jgi:hypothetical protein